MCFNLDNLNLKPSNLNIEPARAKRRYSKPNALPLGQYA